MKGASGSDGADTHVSAVANCKGNVGIVIKFGDIDGASLNDGEGWTCADIIDIKSFRIRDGFLDGRKFVVDVQVGSIEGIPDIDIGVEPSGADVTDWTIDESDGIDVGGLTDEIGGREGSGDGFGVDNKVGSRLSKLTREKKVARDIQGISWFGGVDAYVSIASTDVKGWFVDILADPKSWVIGIGDTNVHTFVAIIVDVEADGGGRQSRTKLCDIKFVGSTNEEVPLIYIKSHMVHETGLGGFTLVSG